MDKTVSEIIEEVCDEMCNHYCKYTEQSLKALDEDEMFEVCDSCPLNKLH